MLNINKWFNYELFCFYYLEFSTKKKRRIVLLSESSDEDDPNKEIELTFDDFIPINNEPETNMCTQQLMDLCSGKFQTQQSESEVEILIFLNFTFEYLILFIIFLA